MSKRSPGYSSQDGNRIKRRRSPVVSSRRRNEGRMECKVYIGNLTSTTDKNQIERAFSQYGPVRNVFVARNPAGFGFVEFEDPRDARESICALDGRKIGETHIRVEMAHGRRRNSRRRSPFPSPQQLSSRHHRQSSRRRRRSRSSSQRRKRKVKKQSPSSSSSSLPPLAPTSSSSSSPAVAKCHKCSKHGGVVKRRRDTVSSTSSRGSSPVGGAAAVSAADLIDSDEERQKTQSPCRAGICRHGLKRRCTIHKGQAKKTRRLSENVSTNYVEPRTSVIERRIKSSSISSRSSLSPSSTRKRRYEPQNDRAEEEEEEEGNKRQCSNSSSMPPPPPPPLPPPPPPPPTIINDEAVRQTSTAITSKNCTGRRGRKSSNSPSITRAQTPNGR